MSRLAEYGEKIRNGVKLHTDVIVDDAKWAGSKIDDYLNAHPKVLPITSGSFALGLTIGALWAYSEGDNLLAAFDGSAAALTGMAFIYSLYKADERKKASKKQ